MDDIHDEVIELDPEEMAAFCFQKVAHLEARFILLCLRVGELGIDCTDLCDPWLPDDGAIPLRVMH